jgi:hypothetical protein
MNKREFMLAAGAAGIGGAAWSAAPAQGVLAWRRRVGQTLRAVGVPGAGVLQLQRVDIRAATAPLQQYTLLFSASQGPCAAGLHTLHLADGAAVQLYLEHAGADTAGVPLLRADCCHMV